MYQFNNQKQAMHDASQRRHQAGFSLLEVVVATTVMLIVVGAVFSLLRDSMKVAMTTYELTDAQENLRISHEFIHRDLMNTGDGLGTMSNILVPTLFVQTYVTAIPNADVVGSPGVTTLGIITSDDKLAPLADRITIMEVDPDFLFNALKTIPLDSSAITSNSQGSKITIPAGDPMTKFTKGEVYFVTSNLGGTFGTVTGITGRKLEFDTTSTDDPSGLNLKKTIETIGAGTAAALWRMRIIHYYVTSAGLLKRRVFGVPGSGYQDGIVAEHVKTLQFGYSWIYTHPTTGIVTAHPIVTSLTSAEQPWVRQVEVTVEVETPHAILKGARQPMSMTTSTSVRNMQFRKALQ